MPRLSKGLFEELNRFVAKKDKEVVLESRAVHVIDSAINLLAFINENFDSDAADELCRRFINSIKTGDNSKFVRSVRKMRDTNSPKFK